jgi:glucokinase
MIEMVTISDRMGTVSLQGAIVRRMAGIAKNRVLTFDVGGSHVAAAVCRDTGFHLGPVVTGHYESVETGAAFIDLLTRLGSDAAGGLDGGIAAALAVPGPFDLEAGVSRMRHKLAFLYGVDLRHALASRFGCDSSDVKFLNDANAYLLGEVGAGAARGFSRAIGLTLGTGIGSAFAVDGRVVTEGRGVPKDGEIWNLPYENGTVEDFVSTRAITSAYARRTGETRSPADLAAAAPSDAPARDAFTEFGQHLGRVIGTVLADFGADVVVLGGGISHAAQWFLPAVHTCLPQKAPELRVSELMDHAALVGCGVAWFRGLTSSAGADDPALARGRSLPG